MNKNDQPNQFANQQIEKQNEKQITRQNEKQSEILNQVGHELSDDDWSLILYNLSLTPEQRALNHQRALDTLNELILARKQIYGKFDFNS